MMLEHRFVLIVGLLAGSACVSMDATSEEDQGDSSDRLGQAVAEVSVAPVVALDVRIAACLRDPRVVVGVVSVETCVGADLFFRDSFGGNGRTCATCHPVDNNLTIDPRFIASLPDTDPLFVAERIRELEDLEKPRQMRRFGLILENVDGFEPDPTTHFVLRSVPHTLSLATSVARPPGSPVPPIDFTGWSGDGAPNPGALRDFMTGAIRQHYTRSLERVPGRDFRLANDRELKHIDHFMRRTGRLNELSIGAVVMSDAGAELGRVAFQQVGCEACHGNAGANSGTFNFNFNTGVESARHSALAAFPLDGGFGLTPNPDGSFGDGTFNTPPLIEAADTGPFFHTATTVAGAPAHNTPTASTIEQAIAFYTTPAFSTAPNGFPINLSATAIDNVGRFLRGLNAVFNAAIAIKRIDAGLAVVARFHDEQLRIQRELIRLANVEVRDAIVVLSAVPDLNVASLISFQRAARRLRAAQETDVDADRVAALLAARRLLSQGSSSIGTNLNYRIGDGSVMF
jgi:cytochrome c553